jgi:DNA repair photolyase
MVWRRQYDSPLSVTSQFPFCGLPLRLDSYRGCQFQCGFCFARNRIGMNGAIAPARVGYLRGVLRRVLLEDADRVGILGEFLRHRTPIHFGGMSDPFHDLEERFRVTEDYLTTLRDFDYPTVISTRGTLVAREPYLSILKEMGKVIVQFSLTSTSDVYRRQLEPNSPTSRSLLSAMNRLSSAGVIVTCRWQPYVPGKSEDATQFVRRVAAAGARHLALEHLKVPIDAKMKPWQRFERQSGVPWRREYRGGMAVQDGREYIFSAPEKLTMIQSVAALARESNMTFGAADNEYQYLSDTKCCCSGVDQFAGFENWFRHQIAYAIRKSKGNPITYESIEKEWAPQSSVDRFLNSHIRIGRKLGIKGTISDHVRFRWNEPSVCSSPASFAAVIPTQQFSPGGFRIYQWERAMRTRSDQCLR